MIIFNRILAFLNKGSERNALLKKNILATFFIKGLGILISLLYVPITLNYLNPTRYGIWMTLTSIVAWMGIFDIGLGNGLRNKLAEALALGDKEKARKYVSTAYAMLGLIVASVIILFFIANHWINWSIALNTTASYGEELKKLALIVVTLFGFKFVLNIISIIFTADQRPAIGSIFEVVGSAIGLLIIWLLTLTGKTSLVTFGLATMLAPVLIYTVASFLFYNGRYSYLKPTWKAVDLIHAKSLTGLGLQFFVIQIAVLVIFQTSNILIAQYFSPAEVTPYNIAFKYFSIITMVWGIVMTPLWSAFTQALALNDIEWMRRTIARLNKLLVITILIIMLMALGSHFIISIWTAGQVTISPIMIWIFAIYTFISIWNNIYSFFLNGISKIRVQIFSSIAAAILHIPIAFLLVKHFKMGSEGVVLSMAISLSFFAIAGPIQSYKYLKAWNKI
jgi:O-antigen/teichoic acid export membrane protein